MHPINKHHYDLLEKWRHAMDLVGPSDIDHHFEDAINSVQYLPECETWADLGSGAGFPGFALAAQQPNAFVSMIESRQKRCAFLRNVVRTAQIKNIEIIQSRTEKIDTLLTTKNLRNVNIDKEPQNKKHVDRIKSSDDKGKSRGKGY